MTKSKVVLFVASAFVAGFCHAASFGPLTPSAKPCEREYIWPEGKMPDAQPHQIAAKTGEKKMPGFKADDFRRPYIDWYAPNPECKTDLCVMTISGGGFGSCCDAARNHCFQSKASPGTGSYTYLDRIWEFMNHKGYNR